MASEEGETKSSVRSLRVGPVSVDIVDGDPRNMRIGGTEVLRRISYPVRDRNWGTFEVMTENEDMTRGPGAIGYVRTFRERSGAFKGRFEFQVEVDGKTVRCRATVVVVPSADLEVNRLGFTVLHPLEGVAGRPMLILHPDGSEEEGAFPAFIATDAPAKDITGLIHTSGDHQLEFRFEGEVFEMEDQRNWSDASYKTFCRPLRLPYPFRVPAGISQKQEIRLTVTPRTAMRSIVVPASRPEFRFPRIALTADLGMPVGFPDRLAGVQLVVRVPVDAATEHLAALAGTKDLTIEIMLLEGDDGSLSLPEFARRCDAASVRPTRVIAFPQPYLKALPRHPDWPSRPTLEDVIPFLRIAFPGVPVGGGSLTLFTEFNRYRPRPELVDFLTFGNSAIVHAADDASVIETLEAIDHIFVSAREIAAGLPLHLGLLSIGMRTNPYGADVVPNPRGVRLPMARHDPRQWSLFGAAYAVGLIAAAAEHGVESIALAMTDGPLGIMTPEGPSPLFQVIRAACQLGGEKAFVERGPGKLLSVGTKAERIVTNLGTSAGAVPLRPGERWAKPDGTNSGDVANGTGIGETARHSQTLLLAPFDVAFVSLK